MEPIENAYAQMLEKQLILLDWYKQIESLLNPPVDIHTKSGQKLIKEFIRRFIEELCEAHDCIHNAYDNCNVNNPELALREIINHNIEIADAWHFLLETLIFMGYDDKIYDILRRWIHDNAHGYQTFLNDEDNLIRTGLKVAQAINFANSNSVSGPGHFIIIANQTKREDHLHCGNKKVSQEIITKQDELLWNIVYALNLAMNELKNKDWSQSAEKKVNTIAFEGKLIWAILSWFLYLDYGKFSETGIFYYYSKKNEENLERIKNKY